MRAVTDPAVSRLLDVLEIALDDVGATVTALQRVRLRARFAELFIESGYVVVARRADASMAERAVRR